MLDTGWKTLEWLASGRGINGDDLEDRITFLEDVLIDVDASERAGTDLFKADATPENITELRELRKIVEEIEGYADEHVRDVYLIPEDEFPAHAKELAIDTGAINDNLDWPIRHIDWRAAAEELKDDYTSIEISGRTFWYR